MKFISRVEQDISLARCAYSLDILFTLEINFIFPCNHVIFSMYYTLRFESLHDIVKDQLECIIPQGLKVDISAQHPMEHLEMKT